MILRTVLFLTACVFQSLAAAQLHVVYVVATLDAKIGPSLSRNIPSMHQFFLDISQSTGLPLSTTFIADQAFHPMQVKASVQALSIQPDDVVVFYYQGHGIAKGGGSTPWPHFDFSNRKYMSFENIASYLQGLNPRLLVMIAECCNNRPGQQPNRRAFDQPLPPPNWTHLYRTLILETSGTVFATSSLPGEFSFIVKNPTTGLWGARIEGGIYTHYFLESLAVASHQPTPSWAFVLDRTGERTQLEAKRHGQQQTPFYSINTW